MQGGDGSRLTMQELFPYEFPAGFVCGWGNFAQSPVSVTHNVFVRMLCAGRYDMERCARMKDWHGGEELRYPDLSIIEGIGRVPYHAVCV